MSSPASRPRRPASSISAAPAPPCSTGSMRATMAASSLLQDRGYRQGALDPGGDRRDPRRDDAGSASTGTARRMFQSEFADRHAEVAHELLGERPRLSLLDDARRSWPRSARRRRPSGGRSARAAPGATAERRARRALRRPAEGAAGGRDGHRRPGPGPGHRPERRARRFRAAPLGRHADLHARRGGRRSRHGRHPRHPRRRSSQQRLPPARDHPRDGLAGAGLCAMCR